MKQISGMWFECKVRYEQTQEDGTDKTVTETYVYKAADFGEAYDKAIKNMSTFISGEFGITAMKIAQYGEVVMQDDRTEDKYYRVNADAMEKARKNADTIVSDTMIDVVIEAIQEAKIIDVIFKK